MSGRRTRERSGTVVMASWYARFREADPMLAESFPAMFEPDAESMDPGQRAELQRDRLCGLVDRLLAAGGVQGDRLTAAGVTGGADVSLGNLAALPATTKQDLWDGYPFGLLAIPREQVVAVHGASGTGGRPTLVSYSRADIALWARMCARALAAAGAGPGSIVHNAYGYGLFTGGIGIHQGAIELGATVVPISGGMTARQVTLIADLRPDILTCTPSYAIRLGEALAAEGLHVNGDHFLVEAVGPVTGQPVPDGTPGELVFSTLTKEALPLLRYRTGDIAALRRGSCACGRTLVKMSKITGRKDDMLVIRGVNVYPSEIERILLAEPAVASDYLVVVDERDGQRELIACCERITGSPGQPSAEGQWLPRLADDLEHRLREALGVRVRGALLPPGSVPRTEVGKAVRVRRWSGGEPPIDGLVD